ncbi:MAG: BamA/TamA family outer membrane protein [Gammaproteobacteria bacterium]|nr:BamA/TamA family outer membrane protein [Gammaproteobacteria bacterium]MBT8110931.1 BamA/TamA family outer membrane protein [Gammaproteobacteria bacterium]NND47364.1 BamA/TamA family outer membrane protein [Woeseiaceae bacterium]NNL45629.1 BamA/TamA family outer membrane protein [Woeseiaceae bacterium]
MRLGVFTLIIIFPTTTLSGEPPDSDTLERDAAVIGEIMLEKRTIFDLSNPDENNWLYRLANRLHIVTQDKVIRKQLLFRSGDAYSTRVIDESARVLRRNRYLFDAEIKPVRYKNGTVDLTVVTRDVWTLNPDISVTRSGGENRTRIGLEDTNLLGRGQLFRVARTENVDRTSTSFEFADDHLGRSWVSTFLKIADNSDGKSNVLSAIRPFYALDTRWSAGGSIVDDERRSALYLLGNEAAEYQHERDYVTAFGGWSKGLQQGWVRRWTAGIVHDQNRFAAVLNATLPDAVPDDRKLVYAFVGLEVVEDQFQTARNRDQIGKTEDFYLGSRLSASVGWSDESFGADRDALMFSARTSRGFGSLDKTALLLSLSADGRVESGHARNAQVTANARYYRTQSHKRLFFASVAATSGHSLDLDDPVQLGGDSGLRGYPLRYQSGDSKLLLTIEQRYFTDWYPFRLVRIGGAVFADAGRVWGKNPLGSEPYGWLSNVGFGLRFAPTRSSAAKMIHLDVAFPLGGDNSIDSLQILLESKRGF